MQNEPRDSTPAALAALAFGNFVIGTGTLIVPGMLPRLADGLDTSLPVAGQLVTAFAAAACLGAPLLATATGRFDRRRLLVAVQILFALGHVAAALVSSFLPMLVTRVASSAAAALFTAQAAATAALLVPAPQRGRAIALVFLGWSLASVVGMPLGAYVGASLGWRAGFALIAGGSALAAVALWSLLPPGLQVQPLHRAMWRTILSDRTLLLTLCVTMLSMAAGFTLFSYLVPAARELIGATPAMISALLAAFGAMGIIGNMLAVRFMDRLGAGNVVLYGLLAMLAGHLLWPWSPGALAALLAALVAFGLGVFASNSAQQARLVALSPAQAPASIALNSSSVYLGQAAGSAVGGIVLAHLPGSAGYASLPWLSVPMLLAAIALSLVVSARSRMVPSVA